MLHSAEVGVGIKNKFQLGNSSILSDCRTIFLQNLNSVNVVCLTLYPTEQHSCTGHGSFVVMSLVARRETEEIISLTKKT